MVPCESRFGGRDSALLATLKLRPLQLLRPAGRTPARSRPCSSCATANFAGHEGCSTGIVFHPLSIGDCWPTPLEKLGDKATTHLGSALLVASRTARFCQRVRSGHRVRARSAMLTKALS